MTSPSTNSLTDTSSSATPSAETLGLATEPDEPPEMNSSSTAAVQLPEHRSISAAQQIDYNAGTVIGVALTQYIRRMLDHRRLGAEFVKSQDRTFVRPAGFDEIEHTLREQRVVVLLAQRDRGLHHAAVHLLARCGAAQLLEAQHDPDTSIAFEDLLVDGSSGLLLDMRRDQEIPSAFGRMLADLSSKLRERRSYVVVIGSPDRWSSARSGADHLVRLLEPAPAAEIVRLRLKPALSDATIERYLTEPQVFQRLRAAIPSDAVDWADDIKTIERDATRASDEAQLSSETERETFAGRVSTLIAMRSHWRETLLEIHRGAESRERNFLLAAGVLEGSAAGTVFVAAGSLAKALGESATEPAGHEGRGLIELCADINVRLGDDDRVWFDRTGFADAVLEYFWVDRQHLRDRFLRWMISLPVEHRGDARALNAIVERIAPLILRRAVSQNKASFIGEAATLWAEREELRAHAGDLLLAAALDDELGASVRAALLGWARGNSVMLKVVLADVCSGPLVGVRPRPMLFRLAELARSTEPAVIAGVHNAVARLWAGDHRIALAGSIESWCRDSSQPGTRKAGASMFASLAAQITASEMPEFHDRHTDLLTVGWSAVLDTQSHEIVHRALSPWIECAMHPTQISTGQRDLVISMLAAAIREHGGPMGLRVTNLSRAMFTWQPVSSDQDLPYRAALRNEIQEAAFTEISRVEGDLLAGDTDPEVPPGETTPDVPAVV